MVQVKEVVEIERKSCLTAHAGEAGVAVISHDYTDGGQRAELVTMSKPGQETTMVKTTRFFELLDAAVVDYGEDEVEEDFDRYEGNYYKEMLALSKFRAFGESSNFNELAQEQINYGVRGSEIPFINEIVDLGKQGKIEMPGEIRGFSEVINYSVSSKDMEPFTIDEAVDFIIKVFSYHEVKAEQFKCNQAVELWLKPTFIEAVEKVSDLQNQLAEMKSHTPEQLLAYLKISKNEMDRAKTTVRRDSLGEDWAHQSFNNIGQRNGTIEDRSRQNDRNYTTQEQYHTLGERVDGKYVLSEELDLAGRKNKRVYDSMFYSGGEVKNMKLLEKLLASGISKTDAIATLFKQGEIARKGENKGWPERSVYFMRCAAERNLAFSEKLWHALTWPLDLVESCLIDLKNDYKASVRSNSAGPHRAQISGKWQPAPMVGDEAITHLRKSLGDLKGKKVSKDINVMLGPTWHKLMLNKKHMDALEEAVQWRRGFMKVNIGGEIVEEQFEQTFEGLPRQYVLDTYGTKS